MIADTANGWAALAALAAALPATLAAIASIRNRAQLRTSNGRTVAEQVETLTGDVATLKDTALQNQVAILWLQRELTGRTHDADRAGE